jgi:endonuclease/exonuclease/phosphatase family metal-dependent hydrolase
VRPPRRGLGAGLLAVVVVAVIGATWFAVSPPFSSSSSSSSASFSLLQMNLCLSGQAGCYSPSDYPAALDEAATAIDGRDPDAVTINEACRRDVAELARRTGYQLSFTGVDYGGAPLPCIDPAGRGLFGIAVLTKDTVRSSQEGAFTVRADPEERRWLCTTTDGAVTVCTAHLSTPYSPGDVADNDVQCLQLRQVLARRATLGTTFFGGDLNRQEACAPATMWVARDTSASQSAGVQHIYASRSVDEPSTSIIEATYTDHDFLLAAASAAPDR